MDDLTLLRGFRAECAGDDPRARAAALRALEARFEMAGAVAQPDRTRRRHRGLFALSGAALVAAIVAVAIVVGSGSTASSAAAEVLRRAAVAAAGGPRPVNLKPGQLLYSRLKTVELEGWIPGGQSYRGGLLRHPRAFNALVPTIDETWAAADVTRARESIAGPPRFFSGSERRRWKQAGSPLPGMLDPANQRPRVEAAAGRGNEALVARRGLFDLEITFPKGRGRGPNLGFPDVSGLPTNPEALRHAIEYNQDPALAAPAAGEDEPIGEEETILALWVLVRNPRATPALRAATFNALAELPGIELRTDVKDVAGREGDAIRYFEGNSGEAIEDIFDPDTSEILGDRWVLVEPGKSPATASLPKGLVIQANAYLGGRVVNSTHER
jgi:hypothetical protein